jgi:hypothetical protein
MSAAGVVSVACIKDMSSREARQFHSRNAALGANTMQNSLVIPAQAGIQGNRRGAGSGYRLSPV